jgi:hypothetical protein
MNGFLSNLPKGITIDDTFSLNELIGLALKFHGYNSNSMQTYTLPENSATIGGADVEVVAQPAGRADARQHLWHVTAATDEPTPERRRGASGATGHYTRRPRRRFALPRPPPRSTTTRRSRRRRSIRPWPCRPSTRCPAFPS